MAQFEKKPGDFVLFRTKEKASPKSPDMTGNGIGLDGSELDISAWTKISKSGDKFLSIKIKPKFVKMNSEQNRYGGSPNPTNQPAKDAEDDGLPF